MSTVCFRLARQAEDAGHLLLAHILRLAAGEALSTMALSEDDLIGSYQWDRLSNLVYVDPSVGALYGFEPKECAGGISASRFFEHVHKPDLPDLTQRLAEYADLGGPFELRFRIDAGRKVRSLSSIGHMILDEDRSIIRIFGVVYETVSTIAVAKANLTAAKTAGKEQ